MITAALGQLLRMADPLSILGGVSAATALAEQLSKVIGAAVDVYKRYKDPESTQNQLAQVEQVSSIADLACFPKSGYSKILRLYRS